MGRIQRFNLRVYAVLSNSVGEVLLTHERYGSEEFHKFPGGGLEFGEGTLEGLRRELKEELGIEVNDLKHLFTTDEYVPSAFRAEDQIISIYYRASLASDQEIADFDSNPGSAEILKRSWYKASELSKHLRFPMDLKVAELIQNLPR